MSCLEVGGHPPGSFSLPNTPRYEGEFNFSPRYKFGLESEPLRTPRRPCIALQASDKSIFRIDLENLAQHSTFIKDMMDTNPQSPGGQVDEELTLPLGIGARSLQYCLAVLEILAVSRTASSPAAPLAGPLLPQPYSEHMGDILTFADMLDCTSLFNYVLGEVQPSAIPTKFLIAAVAHNSAMVYDLSSAMLRFEPEFSSGAWWVGALRSMVPDTYRHLHALLEDWKRSFTYFVNELHDDPALCELGAVGATAAPPPENNTPFELHRQECCDQYLKCLCTGTDFRTTMATKLWDGFSVVPVNTERFVFDRGCVCHSNLSHLKDHIARLDIKCDICRGRLSRAVERILKRWPFAYKLPRTAQVASPGQVDWWHIGSKPKPQCESILFD